MKKLFSILAILLLSTNISFASSALNFGNLKVAGQGMNGSDWIQYTPTFSGFGTPTGVEAFYRRVGDSIEIRAKFTSGTTTSAEPRVGLPSGLTSDSAKILSIENCGWGISDVGAGTGQLNPLCEPNKTYIVFGRWDNSNNPYSKVTDTSTVDPGSRLHTLFAKLPIQGWASGGTPAISEVFVSDCNGWGSTNTYIPTFANVNTNVGSDITYASSASNGASFTVNTTGIYSVSYSHYKYTTDANGQVGISVNGNGATSIGALTYGNGFRGASYASFSGDGGVFYSTTLSLTAGDVVRPHSSVQFNTSFDSDQITNFRITRVQ